MDTLTPGWARLASGGGLVGRGFLSFVRRCAVSVGSVSVVSVRGLRPGDGSVWYVGRSCAGWRGSALGNPFRPVGGVPGSSLPAFRSWLREVVAAGLRGEGGAAWAELVALCRVVAGGGSVRWVAGVRSRRAATGRSCGWRCCGWSGEGLGVEWRAVLWVARRVVSLRRAASFFGDHRTLAHVKGEATSCDVKQSNKGSHTTTEHEQLATVTAAVSSHYATRCQGI